VLNKGSFIHLRSKASKKNLRIKADGTIDFLGGKGKRATFIVHHGVNNVNAIRLQNLADKKHWLRVNSKGDLDGFGKGGPFTEFVLLSPRLKKNKIQCGGVGDNNKESSKDQVGEAVCLSSTKMGVQVGSFPNGSAKDPKKVGRGKHAQFFIIPKVKVVLNCPY